MLVGGAKRSFVSSISHDNDDLFGDDEAKSARLFILVFSANDEGSLKRTARRYASI